MFNISSFLDKLSKNLSSQEDELQKICDVVFNKTGIKCDLNSIKIQNNILFLDVSPAIKNKIFIYKESILEGLSNAAIKITDIR